MNGLQTPLPHSVVAAILPSLALITFFWKGDEALFMNILFLLADGIATILLLNVYGYAFSGIVDFFYPNGFLVFLSYLFVAFAFFATTFLIFFLTAMYLLSFWSLIVLGVVPVLSGARWILPIKDLPVRSIGVMAGVILFVSLSLGGLVHGPSILSMFTFVMKNFIFH